MVQKIYFLLRVVLGLIFTVFGANGLVMLYNGNGFIPMPEPDPEVMKTMNGLFAVGYLLPLVKSLEVLAGVMLLTGRYVNLALVFLGPIVVNIIGVHYFVEPQGLPMSIFIGIVYLALLRFRWQYFKPLFIA